MGRLRVIEGGQGRAQDPNADLDLDDLGGATEISVTPFPLDGDARAQVPAHTPAGSVRASAPALRPSTPRVVPAPVEVYKPPAFDAGFEADVDAAFEAVTGTPPAPPVEEEDDLGDGDTVLRPDLEAPLMLPPQEFPNVPQARISAAHLVPPTTIPPPYGQMPAPLYPPPPVPTPVPTPAPAAPRRRLGIVIGVVAGLVLVGGGLGVGWVLATSDHGNASTTTAAPAPAPTPAPTPPPPPRPDPKAVAAPQDPPPAPGSAAAQTPPDPAPPPARQPVAIASLAHPTLTTFVSPISGQIASVAKAGPVNAGDAIATVRGALVRTARTFELAKKVKELEGLAKEDRASYAPFLARTRRELERSMRAEVAVVKASTAGYFEGRVKPRDKVGAKAELGALVDEKLWIAVATIRDGVPTAAWSCVVSTPDASHTAACKIQTTEALGDAGTRVTAEIRAAGTEWLAGAAQPPQILVEPAPR